MGYKQSPATIHIDNPSIDNLQSQINSNTSSLEDIVIDIKHPPVPLVGAKGDGSDETSTIQAILNFVANNGGGKVLFPVGSYGISSTITVPVSVKLIGNGAYNTSIGTSFKWIGGNNTSCISISGYNAIKDIFITNSNNATGVTGIDVNRTLNTEANGLYFENVVVKNFAIGYDFAYTFYNQFNNIFAEYCGIGFRCGSEFNNTTLIEAHALNCGTGILVIAGSLQINWIGGSIESSSTIGIDLTNGGNSNVYNWNFDGMYFEKNYQTIKMSGFGVTFNNIYINHDWVNYSGNTSLGAIEITTISAIEMRNITFSSDIPVANRIVMTTAITSSNYTNHLVNGLKIGKIYPGQTLSQFIYNNQGLITYNILDKSCIRVIETPWLDASSQGYYQILPQYDYTYRGLYYSAILLFVNTPITIASGGTWTLRAGNQGSAYDQIVSTVYNSNVAEGSYALPLVGSNITRDGNRRLSIYPTTVTSGSYKLMFILAD